MKLCVYCKGHHDSKECPIWKKLQTQARINAQLKKDYFGEAPNILVGSYGYPEVNVGFLSTEQYKGNDEPRNWAQNPNISIQNIVDLRCELVNSRFKANIKNFNERYVDMIQELSLSSKPVDVEVSLNKVPKFFISIHQDLMPYGPSAELVKGQITENPKIDTRVQKVVEDTDLLSVDAINNLYAKGFDEHFIAKIFSAGNLGLKKNRKLVPTRWSITAIDDILAKKIIKEIENFNEINPTAFFGGYFGNYYLVLFFPGEWSYDLFESRVPEESQRLEYSHDYEDFRGRKEYAQETAGGYYAARLSILEKLRELKKKGSVLALRFITKEYWAPLGVWVVREAVRHAMKSNGIEFSDKELMIEYARKLTAKKFNIDINVLLAASPLIKNIKSQKRLSQF